VSPRLTPALPGAVATADDLTVELGGLPVLRGVGVTVHPGEVVALVGGNGSGKSTLIRAVLGLVGIQRGRVQLFGTELSRFRAWSKIGYVPQRTTATQSQATVEEIVASGRLALRRPFVPTRRQDREAITAALATTGLAASRKSDVRRLSGGQQQRVLIARALAGRPELLVLDEPTSGVDVEHQRVLADVIEQRTERGLAVIVVLHEVGPLGALIDRVVVLRDGRVAHEGDPAVVMAAHPHAHPHASLHHDEPEIHPPTLLGGAIDPAARVGRP
jgi:zinc transport system ATP-binding protein